ncbi:MAG TPA: nitronate monooxygenase [Lacunisphaera sp.]|nr:nitronate monooxygenase [Lacunisphaera sp.]
MSAPHPTPAWPRIIQGGMGVAVSHWRLARAVALRGQLGVVSGTALNLVLARRLQDGDPDGSVRRALEHCPLQAAATRVRERYFQPLGRAPGQPYRLSPMFTLPLTAELCELTAVAAFVEVFLAKEGHEGPVGINLLEKIQLPTLPTLFGAMLARVDYVLMGAGIPRAIPGVLDRFAAWQPASLPIEVAGKSAGSDPQATLDPAAFLAAPPATLKRPWFLAIISSSVLALTLARKASGRVDGFVVEDPSAGGHNAPPRGEPQLNARGEPVYGPRDQVDLAVIRSLGRPFWLAGTRAHPSALREAVAAGAAGVQIGTAFAFCEESGFAATVREAVLRESLSGRGDVRTDPRASPTGMPFKVVSVARSLSDHAVHAGRVRVCDLGYLRQPYQRPDGTIGYRCPAEPVEDYVRKGGQAEDAVGRRCLCNGLMAAAGLGQVLADGRGEPPLVTAGDSVRDLRGLCPPGCTSYTVDDVLAFMGT